MHYRVSHLQPRVQGITWVVVGSLVFTMLLALIGFMRIAPALFFIPDSYDFAAYYVAARAVRLGLPLYSDQSMVQAAATAGTIPFPKYVYPPFFAVALQPLAALSFTQAKMLWFVGNIVMLGATLLMIGRALHWSGRAVGLVSVATILLPPFYDTLLLGQVSILMLFLVASALVTSLSPRPISQSIAGVALGLAISIKLYPICLLLPFLFYRRYLLAVVTGFTMLVMLAIGTLTHNGLQTTTDFFFHILPAIGGVSPLPVNQSVWSVFLRFFTPTSFQYAFLTTDNLQTLALEPLINLPFAATLGSTLATIGIWSGTLWAIKHASKQVPLHRTFHSISLIITALLATSPVTHDHYATLLFIPLTYLGYCATQNNTLTRRYRQLGIIGVCLCLVVQRYWRVMLSITPSALATCFGLLAILLTWVLLLTEPIQDTVTAE